MEQQSLPPLPPRQTEFTIELLKQFGYTDFSIESHACGELVWDLARVQTRVARGELNEGEAEALQSLLRARNQQCWGRYAPSNPL